MEIAFYLFSNLFHIYAVYQGSNVFFRKQGISWRLELLCYLGYYVVNCGSYLLFHNVILNIVSNLVPFFCITLIYRTNWVQRVMATVSIYVVCMIVDIFCITATMWMKPPPIFFSAGFVTSLLLLIISRILQTHKPFQKDRSTKLQMIYLLTAIFVPLGSIVVGHFVSYNLSWHSLISAIILLLINISVFALYDQLLQMMEKRHTTELIEKQNQAYQAQLELVQQSQMRLRCLRHDMNNHIFQMQHFLDDGNIQQLREYLFTTTTYLCMGDWISYTHNEAINSILNFKLGPIRRTSALLEIQVSLSDAFTIQVFDLNVILGNLLDNAIEASNHIKEEAQRKICMTLKEEKGVIRLCIGNRFDGIVPKVKSTRKADAENHGIGLQSVKSIVDQYHGTIKTTVRDDWYEVLLLLYEELSTDELKKYENGHQRFVGLVHPKK